MRIEQIIYIVEVAREGNITKAAQNLYITQPSLSNAITALEDELGIKVFERSRNGTKLTKIGESIVEHAQTIINEITEINNLAKLNRTSYQDRFCIVTTPIFSRDLTLNILQDLKQTFPNINVQIHEDFIENIINRVYNLIDNMALLIYSSKIKNVVQQDCQRKSLNLQVLHRDDLHVFMRKDHPLAKAASLSMSQLADHDIAIRVSHTYKSEEDYNEPIFSSSRGHYCSLQDLYSLKRLVFDFGYVAILPTVCYQGDFHYKIGEIVAIPLNDTDQYFEIALLTNSNRNFSFQEEFFISTIAEYSAEYFAIHAI